MSGTAKTSTDRVRARGGRREPHPRSREADANRDALDQFDRLRDIAARTTDAATADELDSEAWGLVDRRGPVRLSFAAEALGVSDTAVRTWIDQGALDEVDGERGPRRVTFAGVVELREILDELRVAGQDRNLLSAAVRRLEGEGLAGSEQFAASVRQMRSDARAV
jgi:hypothetical protein